MYKGREKKKKCSERRGEKGEFCVGERTIGLRKKDWEVKRREKRVEKRDDIQYRRFIEGIMFVAQGSYTARYASISFGILLPIFQVAGYEIKEMQDGPSNSKLTPSSNSLPIHRIANARRMCPCATSRTLPQGGAAFSLLSGGDAMGFAG